MVVVKVVLSNSHANSKRGWLVIAYCYLLLRRTIKKRRGGKKKSLTIIVGKGKKYKHEIQERLWTFPTCKDIEQMRCYVDAKNYQSGNSVTIDRKEVKGLNGCEPFENLTSYTLTNSPCPQRKQLSGPFSIIDAV